MKVTCPSGIYKIRFGRAKRIIDQECIDFTLEKIEKRIWGDQETKEVEEIKNSLGKEVIDTYCHISRFRTFDDKKKKAQYEEISSAKALLSILDRNNYHRSFGKKLSFSRALKEGNFNKAERTKLWGEFKKHWDITVNME